MPIERACERPSACAGRRNEERARKTSKTFRVIDAGHSREFRPVRQYITTATRWSVTWGLWPGSGLGSHEDQAFLQPKGSVLMPERETLVILPGLTPSPARCVRPTLLQWRS